MVICNVFIAIVIVQYCTRGTRNGYAGADPEKIVSTKAKSVLVKIKGLRTKGLQYRRT